MCRVNGLSSAPRDENAGEKVVHWSGGMIPRRARSQGAERLEAACDRALSINARTLTSVRSILHNRLDGRAPDRPPEILPITHANIRGPQFFP